MDIENQLVVPGGGGGALSQQENKGYYAITCACKTSEKSFIQLKN